MKTKIKICPDGKHEFVHFTDKITNWMGGIIVVEIYCKKCGIKQNQLHPDKRGIMTRLFG